MDDAGGGWDDAEVVEGLAAPFQEFVAFAVALELALGIVEQGELRAELVDLHGMVDDEVDGDLGVDFGWIAAHAAPSGLATLPDPPQPARR